MRIVFDLDGTLANGEHRQHFITGEKKNWDAFFEACDNDRPVWPAISVLTALRHSTDARGYENIVEIWSGRGRGENNSVLRKTMEWFREDVRYNFHVMPAESLGYFNRTTYLPIRMRRHKDYTPDVELKRGWLNEARAQGREPQLVFDDRQKVVDMWRAEGIPCFQVAPGDF